MRPRAPRSPLVRGVVLPLLASAQLVAPAAIAAAEDTRVSPRGRDVTIIEGEDRTVYEYRQNGELRMVRIVPSIGRPYYLVPADPTAGYGNLEKANTLVPRWILFEF